MGKPVRAGTLQRLRLKNFKAFEDAQLKFSPGLNLFLGANGTGKTHAMKAAYAAARIAGAEGALPLRFRSEFAEVFGGHDNTAVAPHLGLNRNGAGDCGLRLESTSWVVGFEDGADDVEVDLKRKRRGVRCPLFLPSRELLSMFQGFISAWHNRELAFDKTYYDACIELSSGRLKGEGLRRAERFGRLVEELLQGTVSLRDNQFFVSRAEGTFEAPLVSEGLRKVAMLSRLISNGALTSETLLFWDQPEAALDPHWVTKVADLLVDLSAQGVQVFVSTHSYLLAHRLSLLSEHGLHPEAGIRFHSFQRADASAGVEVSSGATLAELQDSSLAQAYAAHWEFEGSLFSQASTARR